MEDTFNRIWYHTSWADLQDILEHSIMVYPGILNHKNHAGMTLLHYSVRSDRYDMCNTCLVNGADVDVRDNSGRTPLSYITFIPNHHSAIKLIDLLLSYGANIDSVDDNNMSIINRCCFYGKTQQVKHIGELGADVNIGNNEGKTCLYSAISIQYHVIFWFILKCGAYIESDLRARAFAMCGVGTQEEYFTDMLRSLRIKIAFCSVKLVPRMGRKSKFGLLSMDIIRKLISEFI